MSDISGRLLSHGVLGDHVNECAAPTYLLQASIECWVSGDIQIRA